MSVVPPSSSSVSTVSVPPLSSTVSAVPPSSSSVSKPPSVVKPVVAGAGPIPPKFDRSDYQSPMIGELWAMEIGTKTVSGKLDLFIYCPLRGRCPYCKTTMISVNSVGKWKLCYAVPWPRTIVGVDMRCSTCTCILYVTESEKKTLISHFFVLQ